MSKEKKRKLFRAHTETRSFEWEAYGVTPEVARKNLRKMMMHWAKVSGAERQYMKDAADECEVYEVSDGLMQMDREPYVIKNNVGESGGDPAKDLAEVLMALMEVEGGEPIENDDSVAAWGNANMVLKRYGYKQ